MRLLVAIVVALVAMRDAAAAPRKVLVLKLDGDADSAERARLQGELARLATEGDVVVTNGETTFAETASAVGCDPDTAACVDLVRETLAVDEIVYGRATTAPDRRVDLDVHRSRAGEPTKDEHTSVVPGEPVDFTPAPRPRPRPAADGEHHRRNIAIALLVGGGVAVLIGITMWSDAHTDQAAIDSHPISTLTEIQDLKRIEDEATTSSRVGNLLMLVGIGLGAGGGYLLYEDRMARRVTVAPGPIDHGAGITLGGAW